MQLLLIFAIFMSLNVLILFQIISDGAKNNILYVSSPSHFLFDYYYFYFIPITVLVLVFSSSRYLITGKRVLDYVRINIIYN